MPFMTSAAAILDVAHNSGRFATFTRAVGNAGLTELLGGSGPFTVFAPVDTAFGELPEGAIEALLSSRPKLAITITNHVIEGRLTINDIVALGGARPRAASGRHLRITCDDGSIWVNHARLIEPGIEAANGIIHGIDRVILPSPDYVISNGRIF